MKRYFIQDGQAYQLNDAGVPAGNGISITNYNSEMDDRCFNEKQVNMHPSGLTMKITYDFKPENNKTSVKELRFFQMEKAIKGMLALSDLWLYHGDVKPEHEGEAIALDKAYDAMSACIN